jgi:hypothetical protein
MTYSKRRYDKPGHPTKFNKALGKQICAGIERGLYRRRAAALVGVGDTTLSEWMNKGTQEPKKYAAMAQFVRDMEQAEAVFVDRHITQIQKAADKGDWKAASWLAERRRPLEYGKTEKRINEGEPTATADTMDQRLTKWQAMMKKLNEDANVDD